MRKNIYIVSEFDWEKDAIAKYFDMKITNIKFAADLVVVSGFSDLHPRFCNHKWVLPSTVSDTFTSQARMVDKLIVWEELYNDTPIIGFGLGAHIIAAKRGYKILPYVEDHYHEIGNSSHSIAFANLQSKEYVNSHHRQMIDFYGSPPDVKQQTNILAYCPEETTALCVSDVQGRPSTYTSTYTGKAKLPEAIVSTQKGKAPALLTEFHPHLPGCGPDIKKLLINSYLTSYFNLKL